MTVQLKKDIQDQYAFITQLQEQISRMTLDRDAARADLRKLKASLKEGKQKRPVLAEINSANFGVIAGGSAVVKTVFAQPEQTHTLYMLDFYAKIIYLFIYSGSLHHNFLVVG